MHRSDAAGFARVIDQIGSDELLCFATDYPHWQADTAAEALPPLARRARPACDHERERAHAVPAWRCHVSESKPSRSGGANR